MTVAFPQLGPTRSQARTTAVFAAGMLPGRREGAFLLRRQTQPDNRRGRGACGWTPSSLALVRSQPALNQV